MAIDFPDNPVDGQTYIAEGGMWMWFSSSSAWAKVSQEVLNLPGKMGAPTLLSKTRTSITVNRGSLPTEPPTNTHYDYSYMPTAGGPETLILAGSDPQLIDNLLENVSYDIRNRAQSADGPGEWSDALTVVTDTLTVPAQMQPPNVEIVDSATLRLTAGAYGDDGGSPVTETHWRISDDEVNGPWTEKSGSSPQEFNNLLPEVLYFCQNAAENAQGQGPWSLSEQATTPAPIVGPVITNLTVTDGDPITGEFDVDKDCTVYVVMTTSATSPTPQQVLDGEDHTGAAAAAAWNAVVTLPSGSFSETLPGTLDGTYYAHLAGLDGSGGVSAATVTSTGIPISTVDVPGQMGDVTFGTITADSIVANLGADPGDDGGSPILDYDIDYSTDQSNWTTVSGVSRPGTTVSNLDPATQYFFRSRARNAVGTGAWSGTTNTTTEADVPGQMGDVTFGTITENSIVANLGADPADDGGSPILDYDIDHSTDQSDWTTISGVSRPGTTVSGLASDTQHFFRSRARNAQGVGAWSNTTNATTEAGSAVFVVDSTHNASTSSGSSETHTTPNAVVVPPGKSIVITSTIISNSSAFNISLSDLPIVRPFGSGTGGSAATGAAILNGGSRYGSAIYYMEDVPAGNKDGSNQIEIHFDTNVSGRLISHIQVTVYVVDNIQPTPLAGVITWGAPADGAGPQNTPSATATANAYGFWGFGMNNQTVTTITVAGDGTKDAESFAGGYGQTTYHDADVANGTVSTPTVHAGGKYMQSRYVSALFATGA